MTQQADSSQHPWRTWAEIDFNAVVSNHRLAAHLAAPAKVIDVIKANAYGHGAVGVAKALEKDAGASFFAVATPGEALQLRSAGIRGEILLLGPCAERDVSALAAAKVIFLINGEEAAKRYGKAVSNDEIRAHIMLDTGMNRLGIPVAEGIEKTIERAFCICQMPGMQVEGIATHLAAADDIFQADFTEHQIHRFQEVSDALTRRIGRPLIRHCANSAGILAWPTAYFDMVRPGIMLYGALPDLSMAAQPGLRPALSVRTTLAQIKTISSDATVGYGRTWHAKKQTRVATVPIGYADGLLRGASGRIDMLVRGRRVRQIGRICMDLCMLDVTGVPDAAVGDVVTVIGKDGKEEITAWEMAKAAQTIPHEVLCSIGQSKPHRVAVMMTREE